MTSNVGELGAQVLREPRPCALDDARAAEQLVLATQRKTAQAAASAQHHVDREAAQAALGGVGHAAVRAALTRARHRTGEQA